jgi:hypothetical protein
MPMGQQVTSGPGIPEPTAAVPILSGLAMIAVGRLRRGSPR